MKNDGLTRREFTRESVMALLTGVVITITGCGSDSGSPSSPSPPAGGGGGGGGGNAEGVNGAISANHNHTAFVSDAQINAANAIVLDITGNSDHAHTISLSGGELMQIGSGQRVTKTSTVSPIQGTHSHNVTFN